ncbi:MAG: pirin family protein [Gammaproteobacteria bacterium]|nr:pirin family protein [Gammaproteobacteria bacterium]
MRIISSPDIGIIDPFLLLDEFGSADPGDYRGGFPDHPHRGFETVTYMLAGRMRHRDNHGHEGVIGPGGVQWMRAGRGLIHSEMPEQDAGWLRGFQLWVNLPAARKMDEPDYQEFSAAQIPEERRGNDCRIKVIAGTTSTGVAGAVTGVPTAPLYFDVHLNAGTRFEEALDPEANACVYVYQGSVRVAGSDGAATELKRGHLGKLGSGNAIQVTAGGEETRFLLLAARPLDEPIAWHGPFVMNTQEELRQAFEDFQSGKF